MKNNGLMAGLAVLMLALAGPAAAADPVEGIWKTEPDDGAYAHVTMAPCGTKICGVIARSFNAGGEFVSPNRGKTLVIGMEPKGDGTYSGKVWRPSNGKTYIGKMTLKGESLKLQGCVAGGLICSSQTWNRVR